MYADRNTRSDGLKPGSLAIAVAINGGVLAAVLLAPAVGVHLKPNKPFKLINVEPPAPPEPIPQPKAQKPPLAEARPVTPTRLVEIITPPPTNEVDISPFVGALPGPDLGGTGAGNGAGTGVTIDPPVAPPVIMDPEIDPLFRSAFQPQYPPVEQRAGRSGFVTVRVLIGTNGRVRAIEPVKATSDVFFAATRQAALARWRFRPATRDGVPIERWRVMRVTFQFVES